MSENFQNRSDMPGSPFDINQHQPLVQFDDTFGASTASLHRPEVPSHSPSQASPGYSSYATSRPYGSDLNFGYSSQHPRVEDRLVSDTSNPGSPHPVGPGPMAQEVVEVLLRNERFLAAVKGPSAGAVANEIVQNRQFQAMFERPFNQTQSSQIEALLKLFGFEKISAPPQPPQPPPPPNVPRIPRFHLPGDTSATSAIVKGRDPAVVQAFVAYLGRGARVQTTTSAAKDCAFYAITQGIAPYVNRVPSMKEIKARLHSKVWLSATSSYAALFWDPAQYRQDFVQCQQGLLEKDNIGEAAVHLIVYQIGKEQGADLRMGTVGIDSDTGEYVVDLFPTIFDQSQEDPGEIVWFYTDRGARGPDRLHPSDTQGLSAMVIAATTADSEASTSPCATPSYMKPTKTFMNRRGSDASLSSVRSVRTIAESSQSATNANLESQEPTRNGLLGSRFRFNYNHK